MQATLKNFTTLEGYTIIENPALSHLFYEHIRAWKPKDSEEEDLKQASDETLTKINDVICEWIDDRGIQKLANRYKSHLDIGILKPPQLSNNELEIDNNVSLKMAQLVYEQLCKFTPEKIKGKAIYVILYEYYKRYIIGDKNPASCSDFALLLQESRKQEMEEDIAISQALETYIPLQANKYPHVDSEENEKNDTFDCHQHIIEFLGGKEILEEKKIEQQEQKRKVMVIQGKSGSGKSIFCRHLEETLWNNYIDDSQQPIPVYISFPKVYNIKNEKNIILQALQGKRISKESMDAICEKVSFVFIMDGFDEIFDKYNQNDNNHKYFYNHFHLDQWNAKVIVTCRSKVLNDEDINTTLIGTNQNQNITTSMMYLWPFTKKQIYNYIEKFASMKSKNKNYNNWTPQNYEETLNSYPNLQKMIEEPFLLQLILTVLPSLVKQYGTGSRISKAQVYEVFNDQWIDIHSQNIISKLAELRIQMSVNKIKSKLKQYCLNLGFDMFHQGNQVAVESESQHENNDYSKIWSKLDPEMENDNKSNMDEKIEIKAINEASVPKTSDIWKKYFHGDSVARYVLRRVGDNKYQFLHKSCQEYYAAQKIIFDILSWKPNMVTIDNQQFQQEFETHVPKLSINRKLLNEELGIIQFIAERIYDLNPIFVNLKSRLFRIIESSKNNENSNVNMQNQNWSNIKIPYAILNHAFLEGTDFSNANLDHVHFHQACLTKANFTNASMNDIYFGEYAYLEGHSNEINEIQFSKDGTKIISCANDKTIRIWDALLQRQLHVLTGHKNAILAMQFSHDDSKIISCSKDETIRTWDVLSGQQIALLKGRSWKTNLATFSSDGSKVAICSRKIVIQILDVSSGERLQLEGHTQTVNNMQFSPDNSKLVSCSSDKTIILWDIFSGRQLLSFEGHLNAIKLFEYGMYHQVKQIRVIEGHTKLISGIDLSPDDSKILSYSGTIIQIWDLYSGKQIQALEGHSNWTTAARFSPDGSRIGSTSHDNTVRLWDVSSGKQIQVLQVYSYRITFFPNGSKILLCSLSGIIQVWDVALERKIQLTEECLDDITIAKLSSDGSKIALCLKYNTIQLWDVQSRRQIQVFEGHSKHINGILFLPDDSKIVSYSRDNIIRIWDVLSGKQFQLLEKHSSWVIKVQSSPDSSKIVSYSHDNTIRIWDISSRQQIQSLTEHTSNITEVQFSPDGSRIVSSSWDFTIRLWDVLSGKQLQVFTGHSLCVMEAKFSPDGSKIVSGSWDKTVGVWDVLSGNRLLLLEGHEEKVNGVQFSPDGTKIVSCSHDKTVRLWNTSTGEQIHMFEGHTGEVIGAQFSPDGSNIISYSKDNTICIWNVSSGKLFQLLEAHNRSINGIHLSSDGSKLVSWSEDKTIRLWSCHNCKITDMNEINVMKCVWRMGIQSGLSMKKSIWKDAKGLKDQQTLLVKQRGGIF
ncbi:hypothetical protein RFI_29649 [Reticulomyxa filosa]|uniref:NACHT domain-containing protein n=1 Tax=Reticulomyxa filosa TaxID=46433 RepID=X6M2R8_RETFI|nr:hypothetical protein RFI_29649 [Reticulomyxa filosa]|eukprot:ETO07742.1 hypothetical protein RFI_29649 [Reticulomyxa filosa]